MSKFPPLLAAAALLGAAAPAVAQNISFSVSPARVEASATPGQSAVTTLSLESRTADTVLASSSDFFLTPGGEVTYLAASSLPNSCSGWLRLAPSVIPVAAQGTSTTQLRIEVPATAKAGTYWCAAMFASGRATPSSRGVSLNARLAEIVYINVGALTYKPALGNLKFDLASRSFSFVMQNQGNALLRMTGSLTLLDAKGAQLVSIPVPEFPLLPGGKRIGSVVLPESVKASGPVVALLTFTQPGVRPVAAQLTFKL